MTGRRRAEFTESETNSTDEDFRIGDDSSNSRSRRRGESSNVSSGSRETTRKRGRGPSKRPCLNRNAVMARVNRQKKKEYLEKLENKLAIYRKENKNLSNIIKQQSIDLKRLTAEVEYLRNILNNSSAISTLLKTMNECLKKNMARKDEDKWDSERLEKSQECTRKSPVSKTEPADTRGITCDSPGKGTLNLATGNQSSVKYTEDLTAAGISDVDIDQLGDFDATIFDLPNSDDSIGMDIFKNSEIQPDNLIEGLGNSGICLHVNSGRISLEFCSICHLNSINSDDPS